MNSTDFQTWSEFLVHKFFESEKIKHKYLGRDPNSPDFEFEVAGDDLAGGVKMVAEVKHFEMNQDEEKSYTQFRTSGEASIKLKDLGYRVRTIVDRRKTKLKEYAEKNGCPLVVIFVNPPNTKDELLKELGLDKIKDAEEIKRLHIDKCFLSVFDGRSESGVDFDHTSIMNHSAEVENACYGKLVSDYMNNKNPISFYRGGLFQPEHKNYITAIAVLGEMWHSNMFTAVKHWQAPMTIYHNKFAEKPIYGLFERRFPNICNIYPWEREGYPRPYTR